MGKKILLFSDLEGTLLKEHSGRVNRENMYEFLNQISRLQNLTDAEVVICLVSPIYKSQMDEVIKDFNNRIYEYNKDYKGSIRHIVNAVAIPEPVRASDFNIKDIYQMERIEKEIVTLSLNPICFDSGGYGKRLYVKNICETYESFSELVISIYCGNGINDLEAMKFIRNKSNGFVICPNNTENKEVGNIGNIRSDKSDLAGVADGIRQINDEIEKRINKKVVEALTIEV